MIKKQFSCAVLILANTLATPCYAEVFKYRGDDGKWHFTDRPPAAEQKDVETLDIKSEAISSSNVPKDIAASFKEKFSAVSPVERATLAVVSIDTAMGKGAGFFITNDGYIVTNRHVVRPTSSTGWKEADISIKEQKQKISQQEKYLERKAIELRKMSQELRQYKNDISGYSGSRKKLAQSDYEIYKNH